MLKSLLGKSKCSVTLFKKKGRKLMNTKKYHNWSS